MEVVLGKLLLCLGLSMVPPAPLEPATLAAEHLDAARAASVVAPDGAHDVRPEVARAERKRAGEKFAELRALRACDNDMGRWLDFINSHHMSLLVYPAYKPGKDWKRAEYRIVTEADLLKPQERAQDALKRITARAFDRLVAVPKELLPAVQKSARDVEALKAAPAAGGGGGGGGGVTSPRPSPPATEAAAPGAGGGAGREAALDALLLPPPVLVSTPPQQRPSLAGAFVRPPAAAEAPARQGQVPALARSSRALSSVPEGEGGAILGDGARGGGFPITPSAPCGGDGAASRKPRGNSVWEEQGQMRKFPEATLPAPIASEPARQGFSLKTVASRSLNATEGLKLREAFNSLTGVFNDAISGRPAFEPQSPGLGSAGGGGPRRRGRSRSPSHGGGGGGGAPAEPFDPAAERRAAAAIELPHVAAVMGKESMEWAIEMLDSNGDGRVSYDEYEATFRACHAELAELKAALEGHGGTETALAWVADSVLVTLFALALCILLDLNLQAVLIPVGTVLVSASFAIGPAVTQVMNSLLLVLVTRPFDVGDRITASGLYAGEEILLVEKISVLTTSLKRVSNKLVIVPNHVLGAMTIENFKRSPPAVVRLDVLVSAETKRDALDRIHQGLLAYIKANPTHWKPELVLRIIKYQARGIELAFIALSHHKWQEMPACYHENYRLHLELLGLLQKERVLFRAPDVRVDLVGGAAAGLAALGRKNSGE
jgi:hypothetical protein